MNLESTDHQEESLHMRKLVGYPVENYSHTADVLVSVDENEDLPSTVELWRDIRPEETYDVGRTLDGEIVWVKKIQTSPTPVRMVSIIPQRSNPAEPDSVLPHDVTLTAPILGKQANAVGDIVRHRFHLVIAHVKNKRVLFLFSAVTALAVLLISGGIFNPADGQSEPTPQTSLSESVSTDSMGAQEWVRNLILEGQIPEIVLRNNTSLESIVTTPVSSVGGAVLIDVTYPALSGNESLTVLVQKTPDSWRLRHVYDQKL
jgi:hypothetical protein